MGKLPESPTEVRLAATLFLLLLGLADAFGACQVGRFSSFTPAGVAATVVPQGHHEMTLSGAHQDRPAHAGHSMAGMSGAAAPSAAALPEPAASAAPADIGAGGASSVEEVATDLGELDQPRHTISRDLLVQDTHVHLPAYDLTAGALALVVFGLRLSSRVRQLLVGLAFAAPLLDFAGLWGGHLLPAAGGLFGALALGGGFAMGLVYLVVLVLTLWQCWLPRGRKGGLS